MKELEDLVIENWPSYLQAFSRRHRGWLVRVWVADTVSLESGMLDNTAMAIRDLALWDIALEPKDDRTDLIIMTRDTASDVHSDHPVRHVESIAIERDQDGEDSGLLITDADMQTTVRRIRVPAPPETVDGVTPQDRS